MKTILSPWAGQKQAEADLADTALDPKLLGSLREEMIVQAASPLYFTQFLTHRMCSALTYWVNKSMGQIPVLTLLPKKHSLA